MTNTDLMRRILVSTTKMLLSVALLCLALRKADFSNLVSRIDLASLLWFGLAIIVTCVQVFVGALRWREICGDCDIALTKSQATRFTLIGSFFNQTLPSSIGGDAVRLWLVTRAGASWRAATYSVFIDRALGAIALATIVVASLPWTFYLITDSNGRLGLIFVDFAAFTAGLCFLIFGVLPSTWVVRWRAVQHLHACSVIAYRLIFSRDHGPKLVIWSILIHVLAAVIAWCAARSIAAPLSLQQSLLLVPPVMLITMIPISIAGWGLREASMGLAFGYAGLATSEGVNVSLLFGAVYFIVGTIGGLVWILSPEKALQTDMPAENSNNSPN